MASPSELTLECKPHSYSMLLKSFGDQINTTHDQQTQKLEEFLSRLEEERLKIDAFKRELPLCMQLLTNALDSSRQQLQAYRASQGARPVLEEFIPLKNTTSHHETFDKSSDKANWMTTAQLWSQTTSISETKPPSTLTTSPKETATDIGFNVSPKLGLLDTKQRNGGAFLPFTKERNLCPSPTLALAAASTDNKDVMVEEKKCSDSTDHQNGFSCPKRDNSGKLGHDQQCKGTGNSALDGQVISHNNTPTTTTNTTTTTTTTSQSTHRKARRCWSPDLHRRFVNALQMLGGSQVATPKQIRELMKVDGLTNDEVKSHLQKYRLHTRRPSPSPSPQAIGTQGPQLVVLGGIWVPPEYATAAAAAHPAGPTIYGTHHHHASPHHAPVPSHFCAAPPVPQDFYTAAATAAAAAPPPPIPHHHQLHQHTHSLQHQLHVYKATSQAHSSPESDNRGGTTGDRSESIEDGKSESSSWKAESGENGTLESKGLAALREDGEESNGSEITLKF